ncbi:hypothetical protein [Streptomyces sp. NPDC046685]
MEHTCVIRRARVGDLPRLAELMYEHIAYEKSAPPPTPSAATPCP